jgi:hypothetical protein
MTVAGLKLRTLWPYCWIQSRLSPNTDTPNSDSWLAHRWKLGVTAYGTSVNCSQQRQPKRGGALIPWKG